MASTQYIKDLEAANRRLTEALKAQQTANAEQIKNENKRRHDAVSADKKRAEQDYTDETQAAYLVKMLARRELPELLYQQGYNGGLTESALIRLENQYGQALGTANRNYAQARTALNAQLAAIRGDEADALAANDLAYAKKYADLAYTFEKERAKALEQQRAAALKAAAKAASSKKTAKTDKTYPAAATPAAKRARSPKDIYYSLY